MELERLHQLTKCVSDVWTFEKILYVGAYRGRFHFDQPMKDNKCEVDVIEIDEGNCKYLKTLSWLNNVFHCDIRDLTLLNLNVYDMVFWSHGPEMIPKVDIKPTIDVLWKMTTGIMVLMCPWGKYEYKTLADMKRWNMTSLYKNDFENWGFKTSTIGKKDVKGSNLLAWKYKNEIV